MCQWYFKRACIQSLFKHTLNIDHKFQTINSELGGKGNLEHYCLCNKFRTSIIKNNISEYNNDFKGFYQNSLQHFPVKSYCLCMLSFSNILLPSQPLFLNITYIYSPFGFGHYILEET